MAKNEWSLVDEFLAQAQPQPDARSSFMGNLEDSIRANRQARRAAQKVSRAGANLQTGLERMRSIPGVSPTVAIDGRIGYYDPRAVAGFQQQFAQQVAPRPAQLALGPGTPGGGLVPASTPMPSLQQQLAIGGRSAPLGLPAGPAPVARPMPGSTGPTMGPIPQPPIGGPAPVAASPPGPSRPIPAAPSPLPRPGSTVVPPPPGTGLPAPVAPAAAVANLADDVLGPATPGRGAIAGNNALRNLKGLGSVRGLGAGAMRAMPLAGAGLAAGQISSALWDDPNSTVDEGLTGALTGAGVGAGIGSMILPGVGTAIGGALGGIGGGLIGLFGPKGTGEKAVQSEFGNLTEKMNRQLDQLGVPDEVRQDLYEQINMAVTMQAGSKADVKAIFAAATAQLPAMLQDYEVTSQRQSRAAAIQAAILPLMERSAAASTAAAQRSAGWMQQAASRQTDPQVGDLMRAQAETLMAQNQASNNAAYGQMGAAPLIQELTGFAPQYSTQGGVPATDTAALLSQLGLA